MRILVTGGTGYIGGAVVERLINGGHTAVVFDSPGSSGGNVKSIEADPGDAGALGQALVEHSIEAVIHLAGSSQAAGQTSDPRSCYEKILINGKRLLDAMIETRVLKIVFSSSAAVYGAPETIPITEDAALDPISPYGEALVAFERMARRYGEAYGLRFACLRCFTVAGANELKGVSYEPDRRLIPSVLKAAAGQADQVLIYGEDYPTPDGTCVRDYVHVIDVADAHVLALNQLDRGSETYNLGYGSGYSVAEVIEMARQVTGRWISTESAPRRPGDPPALIASADRIMRDLGWNPRHSELDRIIESAWRGKLNRKER
ncbi:MAG: UDP-glucose 4-epimerase GalE [Acidobacteriota bacterium]|nr:MAG: UDP-glucose 4-epimerase GalE [Acidobacteriota bacterium]